MFIDASALVAILCDEAERPAFIHRIETASVRIMSPVAVFETVANVARVRGLSADAARSAVLAYLDLARIEVREIPAGAMLIALDAFARFGKGQRHPAQLNMGDCFAYACARHFHIPLLFKGDDFPQTDIGGA